MKNLQKLLNSKNADLDRLNNSLRSNTASTAMINQKNKQIDELNNEIGKKNAKIEELEKKVKDQTNTNAYLNRKLSDIDPNLQKQKSGLEAENMGLRRKIESNKQIIDMKTNNLKEMDEELMKLQKLSMADEQTIHNLKNQLETQRYQNQLNQNRYNKELGDLKEENKNQDKSIKQLNELLDQFRLKLADRMNKIDSLNKQTEGIAVNDEKNRELNFLLQTKDKIINQKNDEIGLLKRNNDSYKASASKHNAEYDKLNTENNRLRSFDVQVK